MADSPDILDAQRPHWERVYGNKPDLFGDRPSTPALWAADLFEREGVARLLELGCGPGRDSLFFARRGFQVTALDYSQAAVELVTAKAAAAGLAPCLAASRQDVRDPLPFADSAFDACFSHMLCCMALTNAQIESLMRETLRVLRPGGIDVYTVRHTGDPHYGKGIHRGEDMYEVNGFIVHFFSREKIERLAEGCEVLSVEEFEEGDVPRRLFRVAIRKSVTSP